uniref:Telomeric repeat-binding factor 2-interacting protein 1 n=1 Tax=Xiphophorus couchianus TaxID=32473 RepID=A0A3B5M3L1_9TELE
QQTADEAGKQPYYPTHSISPVLFLTVEGEPMSFFLRPGPHKQKLQPLIRDGGGILCSVQVPGAILLIDPEENSSVLESDAHRYVSTQYIHDCIKKEEQLDLDDYRLNPKAIQRSSSKLNNSGGRRAGLFLAYATPFPSRVAYTPEEDAAILNFISKRKSETGGNRLWQEMEKQRVTSHSWQSMKSRFKDRLSKNQSASTEVETKEDSNKLPEKKTEAENQASTETTEPEKDEPMTPSSPRKHHLSKNSPADQLKLSTITSSPNRAKEKLEASPVQEKPQRRLTRRQLELEAASSSPEPYGKKLRSDLVSVTKALLKTSGDFTAAADLLLNPSSVSEPFWSRNDDSLLLSADPVGRQKLQEKYGEENVAKRIVFLEVKG